ncbi:MAG: pseudouridine synthase, partial [Myxococcota bacterium]
VGCRVIVPGNKSERGPRAVRLTVAVDEAGQRLDKFLARRLDAELGGFSRRKARVLLDIGGVFVDRQRVKVAGRAVRAGQVVEAHVGGALDRAVKAVGRAARRADAETLPEFTVVHEDEQILVVDKPAGLITAPTPESDRGNLADLLRRRPGAGQVFVVHRIDLETSGLLVFARTAAANRFLAERFRVHALRREYIAVVAGALSHGGGELAVRAPVAGRPARTYVRVVETIGQVATVIRARLETGRTHQIRIHCRHLGHPVLGDRRYGAGAWNRLPGCAGAPPPPRMALHAALLGIPHPDAVGADREPASGVASAEAGDELLEFTSPLPAAVADWLEQLRGWVSEDRPDSNSLDSLRPQPQPENEPMIERYVFLRLKPEHRQQCAAIAEHSEAVLRALPGVVSAMVGTPADDHAESAWDLCFVVRFAALSDVEPYRIHPDHLRLTDEYLAPLVAVKKAWNFVHKDGS